MFKLKSVKHRVPPLNGIRIPLILSLPRERPFLRWPGLRAPPNPVRAGAVSY